MAKGPRYKLPKRISVEIEGDSVRVTLACGHSYTQKPSWDSTQLESYRALQQEQIGQRQRCKECERQCIHERALVALDLADSEAPAVQAHLLAIHGSQMQEDRQTAEFYECLAEAQEGMKTRAERPGGREFW